MFAINFILIMVLLGFFVWIARVIFIIFKDKKRMDAIKKKADEKMTVQMKLPIEKAWQSAQKVLQERAQCEEWNSPPPQEIKNILNKLDRSTQDLLRKYKKIQFSDNGTIISAECLLEKTHSSEEYMIGKNNYMENILTIRIESPRIYEIYGTKVRDTYPSLIHYIAFIEDDTYWD